MKGKILILGIFCTILFSLFASAEGSFNVNIMQPENNSIVKGDFFILDVSTDITAICRYIVDGGVVNEMEFTGGLGHSSSIIGVSETGHNIGVFCEDEAGNIAYNSIDITISLGETRKYLLLENIGDYSYFYSLPLEKSPGVTKNYVAVYNKSDTLNFVTYYKLTDNETAQNFTNSLLPDGKSVLNINGKYIYSYDSLGTKHIAWNQGDEVIYMIVVPINNQTSTEMPLDLINYYLERYPSEIMSKLIIENVDVDANGFEFNDVGYGETINESLIGGTNLTLTIDLFNNYTLEENVTLDDVFANAIIRNTQTGTNFTSMTYFGSEIGSQSLLTRNLFINLPNENGTYEITINAIGELGNDTIYSNEKKFFVNVEENMPVDIEDFIELRNVSLSKDQVTCGENVTLSADVFNGGDDGNSEKVKISLINLELGINLNNILEDLTEGETINSEFNIEMGEIYENKNYELILKAEKYIAENDSYVEVDSDIKELEFIGCVEEVLPIASIDVNDLYNTIGGGELEVNAVVRSLLNETGEFNIIVEGYNQWATLDSVNEDSFVLEANEERNIDIKFLINDDAEGQKTFDIIVENDGRSEVKTVNIHIDEKPVLISSFSLNKKQELTKSNPGIIEIKNNGNLTENINLTEETEIGVEFSKEEIELLPGESEIVDVSLPFNPDFDLGINLVKINAVNSNNIRKAIDFNVEETFCRTGEKGSLRIKDVQIENNGEGEESEWIYLDDISVEVEVENTGNDLEDIVVLMGLFNENDDKVRDLDFQSSDEEEYDLGDLDEGDEETANFEFKIPADMESGNYKLVIKAYSQESGEEVQCVDSSNDLSDDIFEDIKIKGEEDEGKYILFDNFIISPLEASCTDIITVSGDVYNIGKKDQDKVKINLKNNQIGINENYYLDNFDKGENKRISFEFVVPQNVKGSYNLDLNAEYDYKGGNYKEKSDKTISIPFRINECQLNIINNPVDIYEDEVIYLNKKSTNGEEEKKVGFFQYIFNAFKEVFGGN